MTVQEAHKTLGGTVSSEKNQILFTRFGINYAKLDPLFRRGSIILWEPEQGVSAPAEKEKESQDQGEVARQVSLADSGETLDSTQTLIFACTQQEKKKASKSIVSSSKLVIVHEDMLKDAWWTDIRPYVLQ